MKNYFRIAFLATLILSIGVSACKEEAKTPQKKEVATKVKAKKEVVTAKPKPVTKKKLEPVIEKVPNKYFLVLASFKNLKNAERLQKKLTTQGYLAEVHNSTSGFHRVSYKAFSDRKLAFKELKSARASEKNKENWLYIKR